jgi:hypothetical protein
MSAGLQERLQTLALRRAKYSPFGDELGEMVRLQQRLRVIDLSFSREVRQRAHAAQQTAYGDSRAVRPPLPILRWPAGSTLTRTSELYQRLCRAALLESAAHRAQQSAPASASASEQNADSKSAASACSAESGGAKAAIATAMQCCAGIVHTFEAHVLSDKTLIHKGLLDLEDRPEPQAHDASRPTVRFARLSSCACFALFSYVPRAFVSRRLSVYSCCIRSAAFLLA